MTNLHTAAQQDIPDLIAGSLGVSRGTAYDLMREELAQERSSDEQPAQQEPVGYVKIIDTPFGDKLKPELTKAVPVGANLYTSSTAQRTWAGLTDELLRKMHHEDQFGLFCDYDEFEQIARAIEAAHGITGEKK